VRHFVDPSVSVGALGLSEDKLIADLSYFGLLFESLVVRDLRIYAGMSEGQVSHYRASHGLEVDAIVEYPDGTWGAFEVKLGMSAADEAAKKLLELACKIDTRKMKAPVALTVIIANGFAHRRPDRVNVVPLQTLTV
jgi:predicted AAA+ superfamily ATPase